MQIVHKGTCPNCQKPLRIPLVLSKPDDKGAGLVPCGECGFDVALRYSVDLKLTVRLATVTWPDAPPAATGSPAP